MSFPAAAALARVPVDHEVEPVNENRVALVTIHIVFKICDRIFTQGLDDKERVTPGAGTEISESRLLTLAQFSHRVLHVVDTRCERVKPVGYSLGIDLHSQEPDALLV